MGFGVAGCYVCGGVGKKNLAVKCLGPKLVKVGGGTVGRGRVWNPATVALLSRGDETAIQAVKST